MGVAAAAAPVLIPVVPVAPDPPAAGVPAVGGTAEPDATPVDANSEVSPDCGCPPSARGEDPGAEVPGCPLGPPDIPEPPGAGDPLATEGVAVTGHTVVVTGMRLVLVNVLLTGQFLTFGGHFTTVYVEVESVLCQRVNSIIPFALRLIVT